MRLAFSHKTLRDRLFPWMGLLIVLAAALLLARQTHANLLAPSDYDTYTLQALAWRDGRLSLDRDYPWLELAMHDGQYFVSFPPVPTLPMWLLTFFFGADTPAGLMTLLYFLGTYGALYLLCRRRLAAGQATLLSVFALLGGSALDLSVSGGGFSGGVWFQAQLLSLLLTALAFALIDGVSRVSRAGALIAIALAVGCRPFNALYAPVLLWMLYQKLQPEALPRRLLRLLPYCAVPLLIAIAYGAYNFARFGNPLEFGHSYLPEFTNAGEPMFAPSRLWGNVLNILRPIRLIDDKLSFPTTSGFAVYITCPLLFMAAFRTARRAVLRTQQAPGLLLLALVILVHGALLLMHRTGGGWQYGTRYLVDLVPALVYLIARGGEETRPWGGCLMGVLMAINVYVSIVFHYM